MKYLAKYLANYFGISVLAVLALALGGCGSAQDIVNMLTPEREAELAAVKNPPLTVPPDYDLRPPRGGSVRKGSDQAKRRGRQMLTGLSGGSKVLKNRSAGESELLRLAGLRPGVDSTVRAEVDREDKGKSEAEQTFVEKLLKWKEGGGPDGESRDGRILRTLGGDTRPVIKKRGEIF